MWNAIKSDLLDFVTTIQEDTTKTLSKVLGDEEEETDSDLILEKIAKDVRRSFETYGTAIKDVHMKKYQNFLKSFSLGGYAHDIGFVLDDEPEVSRFYAELVPAQLTPEEFWSRLFFRLTMVYRNELTEDQDEDDEEELVWDADEDVPPAEADPAVSTSVIETASSEGAISHSASVQSLLDNPTGCIPVSPIASSSDTSLADALRRVTDLEGENGRLKTQVRTLVRRVAELEQQLKNTSTAVTPLPQSAVPTTDAGDTYSIPASSSAKVEIAVHITQPVLTVEPAVSADAVSVASSSSSSAGRSTGSPHSSGSSGVVVSAPQDTFSLTDDDSRHGGVPDTSTASAGAVSEGSAGRGGMTSTTTATYLAAVDDDDEEEDGGWN